MDIHNNNNHNDHRAATIANASHRRYTNSISHFCNWLAQQPSHRHMTRHNNNGEIVLIYNRVDAAAVKTYLRRRHHTHWSTVMKLHDAIRWGSRLANESLSSTYRVGIQQYIRYYRIRPFIVHKQICFGIIRLSVLIARARRRIAKMLYKPGGAGYERCREEFYNHASISEKIHSNSGWTYWHTNIGWRYGMHMKCLYELCTYDMYDILMISSYICAI